MMKRNFVSILLLAAMMLGFAGVAAAQWQWQDESGGTVFSDRPPPASVPEGKIIKQPRGRSSAASVAPAQPAAAGENGEPETAAAKKPDDKAVQPPAGVDPELQKKLDAEKKAEEDKAAEAAARNQQVKANNCANARRALAQLEPGRLVKTTNERGEAVFLDDAARATQRRTAQDVVDRDC